MKTFLAIIGGLALLFFGFIAFTIAMAALSLRNAAPLMAEAAIYSDQTIAAYGARWDSQALLDRASPELMEVLRTNPDSLEKMSTFLIANFGPLTSAGKSSCPSINVSYTERGGKIIQVDCLARGTTETAALEFKLKLVKRKDTWQVLGFFVNAEGAANTPAHERRSIDVRYRGLTASDGAIGKTSNIDLAANLHVGSPAKSIHIGIDSKRQAGIGVNTEQ